MKTYQDLLLAGEDELRRAQFCKQAVHDFQGTRKYREARDAEEYYQKRNATIDRYVKFLYTVSGGKIEDVWSANYKLKTLFFRNMVVQLTQYTTANGLIMADEGQKEKLGDSFDIELRKAVKYALVDGQAFGFWNLDHLEVFSLVDTETRPGFYPLHDEDSNKVLAGIRYWYRRIEDKQSFFCTLYEVDGYTSYKEVDGEYSVTRPKQHYISHIQTNGLGEEIQEGEDYSGLPIVPLYLNDEHASELVGIRPTIDAIDMIKSGYANTVDESADFYWILENAGGMSRADLAEFKQRMATIKAAVVDSSDGGKVEAHTMQIPVDAREKLLDRLRSDLYRDTGLLDVSSLSAAQKTAQEINAAYEPQDNKCAEISDGIIRFCLDIMALAGVDSVPSLQFKRIVNQSEQVSMIISAHTAGLLTRDTAVRHLPFLTVDEANEEIDALNADDFGQFEVDNGRGTESESGDGSSAERTGEEDSEAL